MMRNASRILHWLTFIALAALFTGCGGPQGSGQGSAASGSQGQPELTKEVIDERINETRIFDIPSEDGVKGPISWGFDPDEPKEIAVVDQKVEGRRATIVLDITTRSSPRSRTQLQLSGQIRTEWELTTGWVLRRWEIVRSENISMKYKDLPTPTQTPTPGDARSVPFKPAN